MWERWKEGWTLQEIGKLFDRPHTSIQQILAQTGGIRPAVHGAVPWRDRLAFRDRLRADPDASARYERLQITLAAQRRQDREACTAAKAEFVRSLLQ